MRLTFAAFLLVLATVPACAEPLAVLPIEKIVVDTKGGPRIFTVEVAADTKSRERGLMFRSHMAADAGMLFDFHDPQLVDFWMQNTFIPLDMLFVKKDGTIANVQANAVPFSRDTIPSDGPIQVVVEINGGLAKKLGIVAGATVHAAQLHNAPLAK